VGRIPVGCCTLTVYLKQGSHNIPESKVLAYLSIYASCSYKNIFQLIALIQYTDRLIAAQHVKRSVKDNLIFCFCFFSSLVYLYSISYFLLCVLILLLLILHLLLLLHSSFYFCFRFLFPLLCFKEQAAFSVCISLTKAIFSFDIARSFIIRTHILIHF